MNKHVPMRMCMACRTMKPKSELIRFVNLNGTAVIDSKMKLQQRGAYLCKSEECAALLRKKHGIERHLKAEAAGVYDAIDSFLK
ncbi:MAG: YlxR family protein [Clostridia bacterium]|nr:YlxR family protein [Clostridia bacterium]